MAKDEVLVVVDRTVLAAADADAKADGLDRSELVERALRHEHLRMALKNYTAETAPALSIDEYSQKVYQANIASSL